MITRQFGIPVTSPGAILRREKDLGTPLGIETAEITQRGDLAPDKIIVELIEDWLRLHGSHGFVFDGFPRTLPQAESLPSGRSVHTATVRSLGGMTMTKAFCGRVCRNSTPRPSHSRSFMGRCRSCTGSMGIATARKSSKISRV